MIPARAHFVWLNAEFPWLNVLAVKSASLRGGFEQVTLHHSAELESRALRELAAVPSLTLRRLDERETVRALAPELESGIAPRLLSRYERLSSAAARSNVLRMALLFRYGGVYLDLDTVTLQSLAALCARSSLFCGTERVAFPAWPSDLSRARGVYLSLVRQVLSRRRDGWRRFRELEHRFPLAANNAVVGAAAGHALLRELLTRMATLPEKTARRRFALGTHLLQSVLRESAPRPPDIRVLEPAAFYPLGPVISRHWFSRTDTPDVASVLSPDTLVVHWYASLLSRSEQRATTSDSILRLDRNQLFSAMLRSFELVS